MTTYARMTPMPTTDLHLSAGEQDHFWSLVGPPDANGCRIWQGRKSGMHPSYSFRRRGQVRQVSALRIIAVLLGLDPVGQTAKATCRRMLCVAPDHLQLQDPSEPMRTWVKVKPYSRKIFHFTDSQPDELNDEMGDAPRQ